MLRAVLCSLVFSLLGHPAHAFEFVSAEIVPGTFSLNVDAGPPLRDTELYSTGPQPLPELVYLDLERDGRIDSIGGAFETVNGRVEFELPSDWVFSGGPGVYRALESQIIFETFRVSFAGEPIAYLPIPPNSQSAIAPVDVAFHVSGRWNLGELTTPFDVTFVGSPDQIGQTLESGISLHATSGGALPSIRVGEITYEPEFTVSAALVLTPEPGTALLLGLGLAGLSASRANKR